MGISIGIDVGTVSAKIAVIGPGSLVGRLLRSDCGIERMEPHPSSNGDSIALLRPRRVQGKPMETAVAEIRKVLECVGAEEVDSAVVTGAGSKLISSTLGIRAENEFRALVAGVSALYPDVVNIFEMGGENSKYIRVSGGGGRAGIADYETNGDCAAGTGSFMDQQATRLRFDIEEVGDIVRTAGKPPNIAGRCSVFAKSDMIHAQQKGYGPGEVLKGLCDAVARNFKSNIAKGKTVSGRTAFVGGVSLNTGVADAVQRVFELSSNEFFVPDECVHLGAIGSAMMGMADRDGFDPAAFAGAVGRWNGEGRPELPAWKPLSRDRVRFLRDRVDEYSFEGKALPVDAYLGIDVGSVSTNLALVDTEGFVIKEIYLRTEARPIEVVGRGLLEIRECVGDRVRIAGVGTTGSGRELIGELVGADTVNDEITAHKTGAMLIGERHLGKKVSTIFEIGGQDAKFISIDNGIVVDFTMNEACAAGTGSFLEEQAEKLDIQIKDEFARRAFESSAPVRLGERCTVYMEQDISAFMKMGAAKSDLIAGLAYSVVQNYLNRVVRGRRIGGTVFFQGGTAYNDAVAAAFSEILDREIVVPPYNGVIGAIGAALLAREKVTALGRRSSFRGYDISDIDYSIREFTCGGCTNYCDIQEFTVAGNRTYWGDKCSEKYRKRTRVPTKPVIEDLFGLYRELLEKDYIPAARERLGARGEGLGGRGERELAIGFPRAMHYYDRFPFWNTYLRALGMGVVTSPETNRRMVNQGVEESVAEPCSPVQVAHGHIAQLADQDLDLIFIPNVIDVETEDRGCGSFVCPWGQTLPYIVKGMPSLSGRDAMLETVTVHFREGARFVEKELWRGFAAGKGISRKLHRLAVRAAYMAMESFRAELMSAGEKALRALDENGEQGIIVAGRPYNVMDKEINLNVPGKLRENYGANVIPIFFLPLDNIDIDDITGNMFWNYGRRILKGARFASRNENLHLIYFTNFKCGPDSYIKHFTYKAAGRPWLTLQFDAHGNDAGMMTRCEAYLDSKGVLRWWIKKAAESREKRSISQECLGEGPKLSLQRSGTSG